jgi:signal transduction histidine kinase/ActR/RegA family two-component response regulator
LYKQFTRPHEGDGEDFSIRPTTLTFCAPDLELKFKSAYFKNNLQLGRICHLIAIFFFVLVCTWNALAVAPWALEKWIAVILSVALIFLLGLAASFFALKLYARYWQPLFAFYVLATGAGYTYVSLASGPDMTVFNFIGIIYCLFFCYTFIRLTFIWALTAGNATVLIYILATGLFIEQHLSAFLTTSFYIFGVNLLGIIICYTMELMSRRDFILKELLSQAEDRAQQLNAKLEQMVAERTRELNRTNQDLRESIRKAKEMEGQLVQAQKMESVGRLAGGVAHDYNNISGIIIGYTELCLGKVSPLNSIHDFLQEILAAAKRAASITRQLLAFARQQTIAPKVIDMNKAVAGMLKILRRLIGENIELIWLPGEDTWPVKIDPTQVDQILANLCVNAKDAIADVGRITIETGGATVKAEDCAPQADFSPGDFSTLVVSDTGKGMTSEILDKVFEPFFTTKAVGQGTGLGLATVYGIVKQNNGFITVESELGKGTRVKIYLPRDGGAAIDASADTPDEIPRGQGEKVLLVEDDAAILKLGSQMLTRLGYTVLAANSVQEAIEMANQGKEKIDLLITDVIMPNMNGREMAKRLRTSQPRLKVLFMSGYTANVIAHHGVLEEGIHFLPKPFSKKRLAVSVSKALSQAD